MIVKKLLHHQNLFLNAPFLFPQLRYFFLLSGYGSGKTSSLVDLTLYTISQLSGKKDIEGKNPKVLVCGITLTFLKKTFSGSLVAALRNSYSTYNYDKANNIIYVGGVEVYLTAIEDPETIFGYDVAAVIVDELDELPTYNAIAVVKSLGDRARQIVPGFRRSFLAFATTSQGLKGTYHVIEAFRSQGVPFMLIRARTKDNIHLPKEYVEAQYKIYNEKEIKCFLDAEFISVDSGLVYPDYNPTVNLLPMELLDTVLPEETVYIGADMNLGFNMAIAAVIREGCIYVVKEYNFPDLRRSPEVFRYDFPYNPIKWIPDSTYNQHIPEFRKELRANKIQVIFRPKNPLVKDRVFLINKLFYSERMFLANDIKGLSNDLIIRQNDKKTGLPEKGKGEQAPDHRCDCLEYLSFYCVQWIREMRDLYAVTIGMRAKRREERGLPEDKEEYYVP